MNGETPPPKSRPTMATVGISQNCVSLFPSLMLTWDLCFWSLGEIRRETSASLEVWVGL